MAAQSPSRSARVRAVADKGQAKLPELPELRLFVDEGMGFINASVYKCLIPVTPQMMPFTVRFSQCKPIQLCDTVLPLSLAFQGE